VTRFIASVALPPQLEPTSTCFVLKEYGLLVRETTGEEFAFPTLAEIEELGLALNDPVLVGRLDAVCCIGFEALRRDELASGFRFLSLRRLYGAVPDELFWIAGRALQIVDWDRTHRFCGRCGAPTERMAIERARRCTTCGLSNYPRIAPAVIVLVRRDDRILLARSSNFPDAFYSVLAGFVEPGEALEDTVRREIFEEVGIEVRDVRYFASQPWPFPHSLMVGFTAWHAAGEIRIDENEIVDAGWFHVDDLPRLPGKLSIARSLIDSYIEQARQGS
jgi:NAD+ diphosphatase